MIRERSFIQTIVIGEADAVEQDEAEDRGIDILNDSIASDL